MMRYLSNLTPGQWMAIVIGILSATAGATAQLTPVFGSVMAHGIVSIANLIMTIIVTPILFVVTGQGSMTRAVSNMPGVEPLKINAQANPTLAALAMDASNTKIDIKPGAEAAVQRTAQQG